MITGQSFIRTRIAPTPSGFLHLGNAYSFALTAALAQATGAKVLLRIDDLDSTRTRREYVEDIFETLRFLRIPWHEGPNDYTGYEQQYSQLHRMGQYRKALEILKVKGLVFACECSRSQLAQTAPDGKYPGTCRNKHLPLNKEGVAWRLRTDPSQTIRIRTDSGFQHGLSLPESMQDLVVRKKDGYPAYQLASVVDDTLFEVDLVVRGEDLWPSTMAQLYLSRLLDIPSFAEITFIHHPLLLESGNKKLSKSAGSTSIQYLRKQGTSAEELYTMIGNLTGYAKPVNSWQDLGLHYLGKG